MVNSHFSKSLLLSGSPTVTVQFWNRLHWHFPVSLSSTIFWGLYDKNLVLIPLAPPCCWRLANEPLQTLLLVNSRTSRNGLVHIHLVYLQYRSHAHLRPGIDPVAAKTPFLAPENAAKWAVLEQWHVYWMERHLEQRHALSQSGAANSSKE